MKEIFENPIRMKKRLIVKKGIENIALKVEDIALIYTENKLVFVIDGQSGKKYITDKKLVELGEELDAGIFFRANRKYIISINFIKAFKPFEKVKIQVYLTLPEIEHQIIVSQESAKFFRKWIDEV
ncbi:LytTR family DNA-binding domain-containing protein [Segetibacter sp.]|jgi:DNA-binding LytR/AlgR family response regulator|uniref:LytR/AlgR family response regulator transcription factor n=1 Tax=Segetibacter sp. TaxID=2231182 RepID=UPI0026256584|nr:LytTR family DNA-binding domain-containing protein [Segetibacter sp.]MCW3081678.1 LytTR family transcriptional regulator [Segetibacter sp.]